MNQKLWIIVWLMGGLAGQGYSATVSGTVKYQGKVPNLPAVKMDADPSCAKKHANPQASDLLVLGAGNTMANVFVAVKSGLGAKTYPIPKDPVVVDQNGCRYEPHVFGVRKGQPVLFKNSDGIFHNVHSLSKHLSFNLAMPGNMTLSAPQTFKMSENFFVVKCDVHPWMTSWARVLDHPFFSVTAKDGKYALNNLPDGTYVIEAWHEKLGQQTATITVKANEVKMVDFTFKK